MVLLTGAAGGSTSTTTCRPAGMMMKQEQEDEAVAGELIRRGPWTVDEDLTLINYIAQHGDGRWNALARAAGLKRTGKSCRLRWLNYLRPGVKRGDFTADEQLLILHLHSRWGNRWSKIAQQLPGRTDNEIKNYWRTRVQKHARHLNCDVNSRRFRDAMAYLLMPRLAKRAAAEQQHQHLSVVVGVVLAGNNSNRNAAAPPCLSALTTETPGSSSCCVVPASSSSSDSSLTTSTESTAAAHEEKGVHQLPDDGGADDFRTTTMQQGGAEHEFWSSTAAAPALQEELINDLQDLTGWVQGFSDADHNSLWSLDDIWRMQ